MKVLPASMEKVMSASDVLAPAIVGGERESSLLELDTLGPAASCHRKPG